MNSDFLKSIIFNPVFFVLFLGQTISVFLYHFYPQCNSEFGNCDTSVFAYFIYFISFFSFIFSFSKYFDFNFQNRNVCSSNIVVYLWFFVLVFYWIPVFYFRGISSYDRSMYWRENSDIFLQGMLFLNYFFCFSAIIVAKQKKTKNTIFLMSLVITFLCGERFTGFVFLIPSLFLVFLGVKGKINFKFVCGAFLFFSFILFLKFRFYYSDNDIRFFSRFYLESGLLNAVFLHSDFYNFFSTPNIILPYQSWGESDKSAIMAKYLLSNVLQIASSTGGLTSGSIIEVFSYDFHWSITPFFMYLLGMWMGFFLRESIYLLCSRSHVISLLGLFFIIIYAKRINIITNSGFLSSLFSIEVVFSTFFLVLIIMNKRKVVDS